MVTKDQLKKIKLIVLDLDGTLLKNDGSIGEETKELIKILQWMRVNFSFASGRLHSAITKFADELELHLPLISLDGSMVKNYPDNKIIYRSYVSPKYVKKVLRLADSLLLNVALCHADAIYFTEHNSLIPSQLNKFGAKFTPVDSYDNYIDHTLEIAVAGDSRDAVRYLENKMTFPHAFGLKIVFYKSHSSNSLYYLEVRKQGSTKGRALKRLTKSCGLNIKETAVVGDWYNDRDLFETGALKIAVQNAVPELIHMADHVTSKTNDEEGVAEFLKMVIKSKQ